MPMDAGTIQQLHPAIVERTFTGQMIATVSLLWLSVI